MSSRQNKEYFYECGYGIIRNKQCTVISRQGQSDATSAYGNIIIPSSITNKIYQWKFKILKLYTFSICLGIDDANCHSLNTNFIGQNSQKTVNYGLWSNAKIQSFNDKIANIDYGTSFKDNDIIIMTLNLKLRTLSFGINNINQGVAFKNIINDKNLSYRMAIRLFSNTSVQLLSFMVKNTDKTPIYKNHGNLESTQHELNESKKLIQYQKQQILQLQNRLKIVSINNDNNKFEDEKEGNGLYDIAQNIETEIKQFTNGTYDSLQINDLMKYEEEMNRIKILLSTLNKHMIYTKQCMIKANKNQEGNHTDYI